VEASRLRAGCETNPDHENPPRRLTLRGICDKM